MPRSAAKDKNHKRYYRIGEVCEITGMKAHVLRYWENEFKQIKPQKTKSNQRLYRKKDVETILHIKHLLYDQKFTIPGARAKLDKKGGKDYQPPKQMKIDFDPAEKNEIIKKVIDELKDLKRILDNTGK
ncbi:MAG: MerR family transcriptional regulator [bacterium]